jgi:hypothetical protein
VFPTTDTDNAFKSESYIKLRNNLQRCAIECGYSIVPRGSGKFCCKCSRTYKNASNRKQISNQDENKQSISTSPTIYHNNNDNKNKKIDNENSNELNAFPDVEEMEINIDDNDPEFNSFNKENDKKLLRGSLTITKSLHGNVIKEIIGQKHCIDNQILLEQHYQQIQKVLANLPSEYITTNKVSISNQNMVMQYIHFIRF